MLVDSFNCLNLQPNVVMSLDKYLIKLLLTKALYFITDEHSVQTFMKLLMKKGVASDLYELCTNLSKDYRKAVTYNYQKLSIKELLEGIAFTPLKFDLLKEDSNLKAKQQQLTQKIYGGE